MKFFVPAAKDEAQAEKAYATIKKFMQQEVGPVRDTRYYAIYYSHNGKEMRARVGDPDPLAGEIVIAIFRTEWENGPFAICTQNRGVARGGPILANGSARAIHFELDDL